MHCVMIKGSIHQEDMTFLNVYAPNNRVSHHVRQKLIELQGEIDESTVIVGNFNITLLEADRSSRLKFSQNRIELNSTISQLDVIDRCSRGTFAKLDHILDCKIHLKKLKRIEIIQCLFSDHNGTKLKVRSTRQSERPKILKQHVSKWSMD